MLTRSLIDLPRHRHRSGLPKSTGSRPGHALLLASAIGLAALLAACDASTSRKPDVLLISLDTLRADHLSSYGYARKTSPFLDKLASEGARFAEAFASASNTAPSHMSLLTGLDPLAHGIRPVGGSKEKLSSLSPRTPILAERLKQAGYQTVGIADNGYVMSSMGFDRGFDVFDNRRTSLPYKLTLLSTQLKQAQPDRPLFVFFHTYETHAPYLPPPPFHGSFTDPDYHGPFRERYDQLASLPVHVAWKEKGNFLEKWKDMGPADLDYLRGLYDEGIAYTDSNIRRLWSIWSRRRDADNTLLIIVSDHGEGFEEHGRLGHKYGLYSELLRVPLIVRGPGIAPAVIEHSVSLTDVVPTIFDFLELPYEGLQGVTFIDSLRGRPLEGRSAFSQLNAKRGLHDSVFQGDLHLMRWDRDGGDKLELYDHSQSHEEQVDLAEDRAEEVRALEVLLDRRRELGERHQAANPSSEDETLSEEDLEGLNGLGYTDGVGYEADEKLPEDE